MKEWISIEGIPVTRRSLTEEPGRPSSLRIQVGMLQPGDQNGETFTPFPRVATRIRESIPRGREVDYKGDWELDKKRQLVLYVSYYPDNYLETIETLPFDKTGWEGTQKLTRGIFDQVLTVPEMERQIKAAGSRIFRCFESPTPLSHEEFYTDMFKSLDNIRIWMTDSGISPRYWKDEEKVTDCAYMLKGFVSRYEAEQKFFQRAFPHKIRGNAATKKYLLPLISQRPLDNDFPKNLNSPYVRAALLIYQDMRDEYESGITQSRPGSVEAARPYFNLLRDKIPALAEFLGNPVEGITERSLWVGPTPPEGGILYQFWDFLWNDSAVWIESKKQLAQQFKKA